MAIADTKPCGVAWRQYGKDLDVRAMDRRLYEIDMLIGMYRAALSEIADDPTGQSSYQAEIAKLALQGKYEVTHT